MNYYSSLPTCSKFSTVVRRHLLALPTHARGAIANDKCVRGVGVPTTCMQTSTLLNACQRLPGPNIQLIRCYSTSSSSLLNKLYLSRQQMPFLSPDSEEETGQDVRDSKYRNPDDHGSDAKTRQKKRGGGRESGQSEDASGDERKWSTCRVLWGAGIVPWFYSLKSTLGLGGDEEVEQMTTEQRALQQQIVKARQHRANGNVDECLHVLHQILKSAFEAQNELAVTNIYEEMGDVNYVFDRLEEADKLYREVMGRMIQVHGVAEGDPAFIRVSLRIADVLARKGDRRTAEIGYRHCIEKQEQNGHDYLERKRAEHAARPDADLSADRSVTKAHVHTDMQSSSYPVTHDHIKEQTSIKMQKIYGEPHYTDFELERGTMYSDPIALLGMCYGSYATFLLDDPKRYADADELFGKALSLCLSIYGSVSEHAVVLLNNYGTRCLNKGRFESAVKYLDDAIKRATQLEKFRPMLSGFYCNYAEALFHSGKHAAAIDMVHRAVKLAAESRDKQLIDYTKQFLRDLEADIRNKKNT